MMEEYIYQLNGNRVIQRIQEDNIQVSLRYEGKLETLSDNEYSKGEKKKERKHFQGVNITKKKRENTNSLKNSEMMLVLTRVLRTQQKFLGNIL